MIKKIIKILLYTLLFLIILVNLYNFVSIKILKKGLATINGYAALEVVSGSMEEAIHIGDIIIIDTKIKTYNVGDIITFKENDSYTTHRIVEINDDGYITKGDANTSVDKNILNSENIIGIYKAKLNYLGLIIRIVKNPITMFCIFVIGVIVCILLNIDKSGNLLIDDEYREFLEYKLSKNISSNDISEKKEKKSTNETSSKTTSKKTDNEANTKTATKKTNDKTNTKTTSKKTDNKTNTKTATKKADAKTKSKDNKSN